jgi:hypothetical protein
MTRRIDGLRLLGAGSGDRKIQAGQAASSIARSLSDGPFGDRVTPPRHSSRGHHVLPHADRQGEHLEEFDPPEHL